MEDPRIVSALFISLKMAYYNVLINTIVTSFTIASIRPVKEIPSFDFT